MEIQTVKPILNVTPPPSTENLDPSIFFEIARRRLGRRRGFDRPVIKAPSQKSIPDPVIIPTVKKSKYIFTNFVWTFISNHCNCSNFSEKWRSGLNLQSGQKGPSGIKELFEGLKKYFII